MSDSTVSAPSPKPRRRWLRWLAWSAGGLAVLLVLAYFIVTSSGFFKSMILPRVGAALNASVTVSDASIHPFSEVILKDLKVVPNGQPALVTAPVIRVRYHLFDILGGNIHVDEIVLASPDIEVVQNPDGSSNLDPLMKGTNAPATEEKKPAATSQPAKPLQIDLGKLTLSNATIRQVKNYADGRQDVVELKNINVTLANLKNGQTAQLDLAADVQLQNKTATNTDLLAASFKGGFKCALTTDLKPGIAGGTAQFSVAQAAGAFANFETFGAVLECEITPTDVKQFALEFRKAGKTLGVLAVSGQFDSAKTEGKLNIALHGIDRQLLNLVGGSSGLDFGQTHIDSTNQVELTKGGAMITASGRFEANKFTLTRAGQTTPTLDFNAAYDVTVDRAAQSATLRGLNVTGTQNGAALLSAQLASPMNLAWGGTTTGAGDAAFDLTIKGLKLADWKPFLGDSAPAGTVGVTMKVSSHQGGKQIAFDLNTEVANLTVRVGSNQISQAGVNLTARGQATDFKQVSLTDYKLDLSLQNQPALMAAGAGNFDLATGDAEAQVKLSAALARLLQALPQPGLNISSGELTLDVTVSQKQKTQKVAGELSLANFSAQVGKNDFADYATQLKLDVTSAPDQIQISQISGSFSQNGNVGGGFDISGNYHLAQKSAEVTAKFTGVNENALRPFLAPMLAGKKLVSVSINGNVSAQYNPQGSSAVKGNVQVANLVVNDPAKKLPATPLAVGLQMDVSLNQQAADVRQLQIALTPTARATNQLQFSGQVDFSKTNAIQGNLKLAADSLDFTRYYDLFAGGTNAPAKVATPASAPATATAEQEPAAMQLPFQNFTFAANLGRVYLHDVAISNFQTTVKIDGGHVVVKPCQLGLNGAPVSASVDADLGVPGYKYDVSFDAQKIPLTPLINTFKPSMAGQIGGTLTSAGQVSGAGITGASLQKNLAGKFSVDATNLNLSVINVQNAFLKTIVNVVASIPEIISDPANALASLLSGVNGKGSLMSDLQQAPIQMISAKATVGQGVANIQSATVQSAAFVADATGDVKLNAALTNSALNVPIRISLSQSIAQKLKLATDTNSTYVALPQFLTITGTVGDPKKNISGLAIGGMGAKSVLNSLPALGGTNASPAKNLLNHLLPMGNNTNTTPVGNLLNQFLTPRK